MQKHASRCQGYFPLSAVRRQTILAVPQSSARVCPGLSDDAVEASQRSQAMHDSVQEFLSGWPITIDLLSQTHFLQK